MSSVKIVCTYVAIADTGDVPQFMVKKALEADDGDFSIFDFPEVSLESISIETAK